MATKIIVPYVYRGVANAATAATILHAVWQYATSTDPLGSPTKYWALEHVITSDGGAPTASNTHLVLLRNTSSSSITDSFIMMRRLDHLIGSTSRYLTVACSFHPAGTDFGDSVGGWNFPATWLSSPATLQNDARITNFGTHANWGVGFEQSSPECYITGGDLAIDHFLPSTYGMYATAGKIDIIETQDSLTVATYHKSGNGFQNLPLVNAAWQHVMHAGDIFTPDNRSDPDTKPYTGENITGEGIMCGWFGYADTTQAEFIMNRSANSSFPHSYARTGKIVNLNTDPNDNEWQVVTANYTYNHTYFTNPNEENWTYAAPATGYYLPQFGFTGDADERNERLLPYRLSFRPINPNNYYNGANLLTRFIKQRWRGIGQFELDGITPIIYGKHANSRYPGSDVSWVHQCSDRRVGGGVQIVPPFQTKNNTVHVWRRDGEFVDLNP